jgi:hypothetical protein
VRDFIIAFVDIDDRPFSSLVVETSAIHFKVDPTTLPGQVDGRATLWQSRLALNNSFNRDDLDDVKHGDE